MIAIWKTSSVKVYCGKVPMYIHLWNPSYTPDNKCRIWKCRVGSVFPGFWPLISLKICTLSKETRWVTYKKFFCPSSQESKAVSYPPTWQVLGSSLTTILSLHCHFSVFTVHRAQLECRRLRKFSVGIPGQLLAAQCGRRRDFCPWLPNSSGPWGESARHEIFLSILLFNIPHGLGEKDFYHAISLPF